MYSLLTSLLREPPVQLLPALLLLDFIHFSFSSLVDFSDGKDSYVLATTSSLYPANKSCEAGVRSKCSQRSCSRYLDSSSQNKKRERVL